MKKSQANKIAKKIYIAMGNRLSELADRQYKHTGTEAYAVAFEIGLIADIESVLLKVREIK